MPGTLYLAEGANYFSNDARLFCRFVVPTRRFYTAHFWTTRATTDGSSLYMCAAAAAAVAAVAGDCLRPPERVNVERASGRFHCLMSWLAYIMGV